MQQIESWNQTLELFSQYRKENLFFNNFYQNKDEMSEWIMEKSFFCEDCKNSHFFIHKVENIFYLYFFTQNIEGLQSALDEISKKIDSENTKIKLVFDFICKSDSIESNQIIDVSKNANFVLYQNLQRMSFIKPKDKVFENKTDLNVFFAEKSDIKEIECALNANFDKISERLPSIKTLENYVNQKNILVYKDEKLLRGICIFSKIGKTMELKHLLTIQRYRGG